MRILVTGGAGFIGSHVVDGLRSDGHEVAVVDDLSTGRRSLLRSDVPFFEVDIRDPDLGRVFASFRPDIVNHHAAQANVPSSVQDPVRDASTNVLGSLNLLRLAAEHGVRKVIYSSSGGAMYGEPEPRLLPLAESTLARPLSPYGASKYSVELWMGVYSRTFGLDYTVLRYANVYGPRQGVREEGAVVAVFATRMAAGQPITIDGDGNQTRDFVYVRDCVAANLAAVNRGSNEAVNIATGQEVSVRTIFSRLAGMAAYEAPPTCGPERQGDIRRISLNPEKAERVLGWTPQVSLDEGLRATFEYFQQQPS